MHKTPTLNTVRHPDPILACAIDLDLGFSALEPAVCLRWCALRLSRSYPAQTRTFAHLHPLPLLLYFYFSDISCFLSCFSWTDDHPTNPLFCCCSSSRLHIFFPHRKGNLDLFTPMPSRFYFMSILHVGSRIFSLDDLIAFSGLFFIPLLIISIVHLAVDISFQI